MSAAEVGAAGVSAAVPMHPEATGDPAEVRWVVPLGTLSLLGDVASVLGDLGALLDDGTIARVRVEPQAVLIRLSGSRSWGADGRRVRDALTEALRAPDAWVPARELSPDDRLRSALEDVLAGSAGDYVRSHGGAVTIASVRDGRASVRMSGACAHCPAVSLTVRSRLESELRQRYPQLVELTAVETEGRFAAVAGGWTARRAAR